MRYAGIAIGVLVSLRATISHAGLDIRLPAGEIIVEELQKAGFQDDAKLRKLAADLGWARTNFCRLRRCLSEHGYRSEYEECRMVQAICKDYPEALIAYVTSWHERS